MRDKSKFDRRVRNGLQSGGNYTRTGNNNIKKGVRNPSKSQERQKSEMFKKVETLEKYMKEIKKNAKGQFCEYIVCRGRSDCGCEVYECWCTKNDADR